jgi:hypothetical protein
MLFPTPINQEPVQTLYRIVRIHLFDVRRSFVSFVDQTGRVTAGAGLNHKKLPIDDIHAYTSLSLRLSSLTEER